MINLLPYKEKRSIEKIRSIRLIRVVALGFVVILLVAWFLLLPTFITVNSRFSLVTSQIKSLEQQGIIVSDINISGIQQRSQKLQSKLSLPTTTQPTDYISIVKSLLLSGIMIDRFSSEQEGTLDVFGVSRAREDLQNFIKDIENSGSVISVDSPVSNFVKSKNNNFKITVKFK